jgi:superfamily I DNA/RNA helicase
LSINLANRISNRRDKIWQPKTSEGILRYHGDIHQVDMSSGEWLVLARTKYLLEDTKDFCEERGWYYNFKNEKSINEDTFKAITDWEHWRKGQELNYDAVKNIYGHMSSRKINQAHKLGKTLLKDQTYIIEDCMKDYGLNTNDVWYESLDEIDFRTKEYIRAMRRNGELLKQEPRIKLSTIHGMKGGECDNVVLLSDLTENTMRNFEKTPDDENRLFYVGATRTKKQLHIVEPKSFDMSYPL